MPECILNPETQTRADACIKGSNETPWGQSNQPTRTHPIPRIRPENQGNKNTNEHLKKARLRANIRIMSQNVNGAATPSKHMSYKEKWKSISQTMHAEKITILAIQEAYLDQTMMEQLGKNFEKFLKILISAHPDNP